MRKRSIIMLSTALVSIFTIATININNVFASDSYKVDKNTNEIMEKFEEMQINKDKNALSSNPYDYVKDNKNYKEIVALGPEALGTIRDKIKNSSKNGLREYILAAAGEEIAKVNLKGESYNWSNGKQWLGEWDRLLLNIPDDVERITSSNKTTEEKNEALVKLGVVAIPYILDKIEKGDIQFYQCINALTIDEESKKMKNDENAKLINLNENSDKYIKWAKDNKSKFEDLKFMVEKVQGEYK